MQITIKSIPCPTHITECSNTTYIIHVIAESTDKQNSMHYLWSVIGSPTIIAAYFDSIDVNVSIDWSAGTNGQNPAVCAKVEDISGDRTTVTIQF